MKRLFLPIFLLFLFLKMTAQNPQNKSRITGSVQSNVNFFIPDADLGTPKFDKKVGGESWLNLNYSKWGFDVGLRLDIFQGSILRNPNDQYSALGIGRWFIQKKIKKFSFAGGYLYDQIGAGIIWRAYEERALFIDQALYGAKVGYQINKNWSAKAFIGKQKQQFDNYGAVIRGGAIEGFIKPDSAKSFSLAPGFGFVSRAFDKTTMNSILADDGALPARDQFLCPKYNTYAGSFYNTLSVGHFSWYLETALKSSDIIYDPFAETFSGSLGKLKKATGYTGYTSISYAGKGLGVVLEGKRTKDFSYRNSPYERKIQGPLNFLPVMAKQNTYRLTTRFSPATQELGEQAVQMDVRYAFTKKFTAGFNFSNSTLLDGKELYQEIYPEFTFKYKRKWQLIGGVQFVRYNQFIYQGKGDIVKAVTPASEFLYKFTPRRSLRLEAQYLNTKQEFGSWANVVAEVGLAPHWLFFVSDMYKISHTSKEKVALREKFGHQADHDNPQFTAIERTEFIETSLIDKVKYDNIHFFSAGAVYTRKANRFALAYVKQVEGINCAGGICRYEPTFHGVRLNFNSNF